MYVQLLLVRGSNACIWYKYNVHTRNVPLVFRYICKREHMPLESYYRYIVRVHVFYWNVPGTARDGLLSPLTTKFLYVYICMYLPQRRQRAITQRIYKSIIFH
jgi:hypothetical protein